jgi:hypothetical protein
MELCPPRLADTLQLVIPNKKGTRGDGIKVPNHSLQRIES